MSQHATFPGRPVLSRRRLLQSVGAGAAVVTLTNVEALAEAVEGPVASTTPDRFSRLFQLPSFATPTDERVRNAMLSIGNAGGPLDARDPLGVGPVRLIAEPALSPDNRDNQDGSVINHTAGVTFLGQFLDHDMTFDTTSRLGVPLEPTAAPNARTPMLDLDSVYGGGPSASPQLYQSSDRDKFRVESGGLFEDLPRDSNRVAIIADPRNDENLMISGMHAAFLLFHNRVVDTVRAQGTPAAQVFATARRLVTWHYQWIILHEFLPLIIGQSMVNDILTNGRRFYRPAAGQQSIPVEFQGAVYRFGHSMVRPSYRANLQGDPGGDALTGAPAFFGFIFDRAFDGQADPDDLRGGVRARRRFIGWQTFFDFGGTQTQHVRAAKRIDTKISTPLFRLPLGAIPGNELSVTSLAQRNLLRHMTWSLPSGQRIAQTVGAPVLGSANFPELAQFNLGLDASTPLWYYSLKEAQLTQDGRRLGPMAGRVVGEVFIGLLQLDPASYLSVQPGWTPTLPRQNSADFRMTDLLRFARVDPASRGQ